MRLFDLGADLARPDMAADNRAGYPVLRMIDAQVTRLETEIDAMNARMYHTLNNGVYRAGFAKSQAAYDEAVAGMPAFWRNVLEGR